jgi:hypothetical protein
MFFIIEFSIFLLQDLNFKISEVLVAIFVSLLILSLSTSQMFLKSTHLKTVNFFAI